MVRGVARIHHVGCTHPGDTPTVARIRSSKNRCAHPSKKVKRLPAPITQKTLARIRHIEDPIAHPILKDSCGLGAAPNRGCTPQYRYTLATPQRVICITIAACKGAKGPSCRDR